MAADGRHPTFTQLGLTYLGHFIRRIDGKIKRLLADFQADGSEIARDLDVLQRNQESMKRRLHEVTSILFEYKDDDRIEKPVDCEESAPLIAELARFFWKEEELIDSMLNKYCESRVFKKSQGKKLREEQGVTTDVTRQSEDLAKSEEELAVTELKSCDGESEVGSDLLEGSNESMSSVTEHGVWSDGDPMRSDDSVNLEVADFCDPALTNEECRIDDILMSVQKHFAQDLVQQANEIKISISLALVELFLLLSTNQKEMLTKIQELKSCLEKIAEENREAEVVRGVLEGLKVADEQLTETETARSQKEMDRPSESDEDKELTEVGKQVPELCKQFMQVIAHLDGVGSGIGHLESRVLEGDVFRLFQKDMKDINKELQSIDSNMEVLRSRYTCGESAAILLRIAKMYGWLGVMQPKQVGKLTIDDDQSEESSDTEDEPSSEEIEPGNDDPIKGF